MVIALTPPAQGPGNPFVSLDETNLQLDVNLSVTLGVTAEQAKRKLTRFLVDEVSLFIHPQAPLLVVADQNTIFWRFPLTFALGPRGQLGRVGEVDVDAQSGELRLDDPMIAEIKAHAHLLAQRTAPAPNN